MVTTKTAAVVAADDGSDAPVPEYANIYEALAAFQRHLPKLTKTSTATVPMKSGGKYSYDYAQLSLLVEAILPKLGEHGISWVCVPTMEDGQFILKHGLHHGASGTSIEGVYNLPRSGTPQEIGSAITYARRYTLLSLTGTFPADEDDDGEKAADAYRKQESRARNERPRNEQPAQQQGEPPVVDPDAPLVVSSEALNAIVTLDDLRDAYKAVSAAKQLDRYLPTGELLRDAINSRKVEIVAASTVAPDGPTDQPAIPGGTAVEPEAEPA